MEHSMEFTRINNFIDGQWVEEKDVEYVPLYNPSTGAVIGEEEMRQEFETYFPMPGDGPAEVKRKKMLRRRRQKELQTEAGRAYKGNMEAPANESVVDWSEL